MIRMLCVFFLLLPLAAGADDWGALDSPRAIALMRHALAPGTGDPHNFQLGDCTTQRNLDRQGRDQARKVGERLRARGVTFDAVWTSQWCRCRETAALLNMGASEEVPALNSFFTDWSLRGPQTAEMISRIAGTQDKRLLLVSHQVNINALTGVAPRSGEIIVVEMRDGERLEVTGRIMVDP